MRTWSYLTLTILLLLVILFLFATLILTFVTDMVDSAAKPGIVIFFVVAVPPLVFGGIILIREWRKSIKAKS